MQKILVKVNEKCEWIAKMFTVYVPAGYAISICSTAALNVVFCLIKDGFIMTQNLLYSAKFVYVSEIHCSQYIMLVFFFAK